MPPLFASHLTAKSYIQAHRGFKTFNPGNTVLQLGEGYAGRAALEKEHCRIENLNKVDKDLFYRKLVEKEGFVSYCAVPLVVKGHVQGVLEVFSRTPLSLDGQWEEFFKTLAGQASIAIDNAELFSDLEVQH